MAQLVGHLSADFSSFTKAVDESVVKLKGFETGAGKVGDSLEKMANKFSGQKIIQEATLMAEVFNKMGGAAAFSEKELQQMGKTGAEALEKMRAQGMEIPANLQKMADSTKQVEKATFDWKSALLSTASAFGVAFSVNALKDFALGVIATAGNIGDMSEKLGISAEAVQRFGYAAEQSGADINTVDSAIKKMNANLAEGSKSTVAALTEAGLKFEDIRRMSPEQAFETIADAVAGIEDPMLRAKVATELFGKAGQELLPTFLAGLDQVGAQTKVMSDDTIARLKAAEDAWRGLSNTVVIISGEIIANTIKTATNWKDLVARIVTPPGTEPLFKWFREGLQIFDQDLTQTASDVGMAALTMDRGIRNVGAALVPVALNAGQAAATVDIMNASLVRTDPAAAKAATELAKFNATVSQSLEQVRYQNYKLGESAVRASQNVAGFTIRHAEAVAINRDFSTTLTESTIKADSFGHVVATNVQPSLQGMGHQLVDTTTKSLTFGESLGSLSQSFAQLGQIGGKGLSEISRGIGSVIGGMDVAMKSVSTFKTGFSELGKGSMLSGIASITSGIGGIVAAASAAISAVKALWSWAKGGEEGQVVNPAREQWFGGRSVSDIGEQLAPYMGGEEARRLIESVFNAKNKQDFGAATGAIDRILAGGNSYAAGTGGFKDFGAGTLALLHGREAVVPEGASLGGAVVININAQGAFFDTPGDLQRLADKVNDALTAKHAFTNRTRAA